MIGSDLSTKSQTHPPPALLHLAEDQREAAAAAISRPVVASQLASPARHALGKVMLMVPDRIVVDRSVRSALYVVVPDSFVFDRSPVAVGHSVTPNATGLADRHDDVASQVPTMCPPHVCAAPHVPAPSLPPPQLATH